jgi:amino acid permease
MIFPNLALKNGLYLLLLAILLCDSVSYWSHYMLIERARQYNIKRFAGLAKRAGGKPLKVLLIVSILIYLFAGALACQIISNLYF